MTAALILPMIVLARGRISVHRWRGLGPVVLAALVVGIPGNLKIVHTHEEKDFGNPSSVIGVASSPLLATAPAGNHPLGDTEAAILTAAWLRNGVADGKIPTISRPSATTVADAAIRSSPSSVGRFGRQSDVRCRAAW